MKFNTRENQEKSNFQSTKVIQAKIGNTAKMLKMFTKDLYKHPLQTSIQEYINNAKDAHIMAKKDTSTIEITAPTLANQSIIIRDFGPGLSPDDIVNIFANIAVSNKDDCDLFNGGFGIGSKSWFAVNTSFIVISTFDKIKTYYSVKFDEKKGIFIEVDFEEETNEANGVEVQLPLANANQIEDSHKAIFRAVEFWEVKPKLINCNYDFQPTEVETEDYTIMAYKQNSRNSRLVITLGRTPYSIKELSCYYQICQELRFYDIAIHFKVGEMKLENVQEVGPDRESFALICSDYIKDKVVSVHNEIKEKILKTIKEVDDIKEIAKLISHPDLASSFPRHIYLDKTMPSADNLIVQFQPNLHIKNSDLSLNSGDLVKYLPMKIKGFSTSYVVVDEVVSQAKSYISYTLRNPYILILDEEKIPNTEIKRAIKNFVPSVSKPKTSENLFNGCYVISKEELSPEGIEDLQKYFTIKNYSEVKTLKVKTVKTPKEKKTNEINLMKVNWTRKYCSNIKSTLDELKEKENLTWLSAKDFSELKIEWNSLYKYYLKLGTRVVLIANSNEQLFKTLKFKKFCIKTADKAISKLEKERLKKLKQEAIEKKVPELYSQFNVLHYLRSKIGSYNIENQLKALKELNCESSFIKDFLSFEENLLNFNVIQSFPSQYREVWSEFKIEKDETFIKRLNKLEQKYPMVFSVFYNLTYNKNKLPEVKYLIENFVKEE